MRGDFSRLRFDRTKNYVSVLQQQGRVALDADANEQRAIDDYLRDTETRDFVGRWGGPKFDIGFHITVENGAIYISRGRYYVEGLVCENPDPLPYSKQPFLINPAPDDRTLLDNLRQGSIKVVQLYLEAWRRLVTSLDDSCLLEPALGQADTTARLQTVWRVVAEVPAVDSTASSANRIELRRSCCRNMTHLRRPTTTGKMNVLPILSSDDCSCQPTPAAGYRGLENQLYRVEIHESGDENAATFKWSRENGSVAVAINGVSGSQVNVESLGFDANLGFAVGQWVEITDDSYEFGQDPNQSGSLYQIQSIAQDRTSVTMSQPVTYIMDISRHPRMRRWDQFGSSAAATGVALSVGSPVDIENGIQVEFTPGHYQSGDYWLIPARTAIGELEWPPCDSDGLPYQPAQPIKIYRAPLACIDFDTERKQIVVHDCRRRFPPLTEITASDVWFDPHCPELEQTTNVQQALDVLCRELRGPCTIVPRPGAGWETPLLKLAKGADADICFPIGKFPLKAPLVLQNLGHIRLSGGGPGTVIAGSGLTAAMIFQNCGSIEILDLFASTDQAATRAQRSGGKPELKPGGTLSFVDCPEVNVENVWVQCGYGEQRTAACISVENTISAANQTTGSGHVRIRHCNFAVGRNQDGVLLVQVQRAEVEDNLLDTYAAKADTLAHRLQNRTFRANALRELISETQFVKPAPAPKAPPAPSRARSARTRAAAPPAATAPPSAAPAPPTPAPSTPTTPTQPLPPSRVLHPNATVTVGNHVVSFRTNPLLKDFWQSYVNQSGPKSFSSERDLLLFAKKAAVQFLLHPKKRAGNSALISAVAAIERAAQSTMSRGIVIAGEGIRECRILNNSIYDALLGISVGMSNHKRDPFKRESASVVTVAGNQIYVGLPVGAQFHARHAVFVGNVDSATIENNYAKVIANPNQVFLEAIRVFGALGRRLIIRGTHSVGFNIGVLVQPLTPYPEERPLWLVAETMAERAATPVAAPEIVLRQNNFS